MMKLSNILKINLAAVAVAGLISLSSCGKDYNGYEYWEKPSDNTETTVKPRYIWIDAAANFNDFADSKENISRDLTLAANAGFTDIVVDVRPTTGDILFSSSYCQQVTSLKAWINGVYQDVNRTATWDYLQAFIDEGHRLGLRVHAGFNTMVGGSNGSGCLFRDSEKREWATYLYNGGNPANVMDIAGTSTKFFNPGNPEVQTYLCNLLADLAKYNIDGIILDRGRYDDLFSDFSPLSKEQFETYMGVTLPKFPADILPSGTTDGSLGSTYCSYTTKWLEFRAMTIYNFMAKARDAVKAVNADIKFGVYVGGWYSTYYSVGVNWASSSYDPSRSYDWATRKYKDYGYASLMDHMLIGAYSNPKQIYGSTEWTMQGFCSLAKSKIGTACPLVAGGPDVDWTESSTYTRDDITNAIEKSVDACINNCDGYFLFDIVHLKLLPYKWDYVTAGITTYLNKVNKTE